MKSIPPVGPPADQVISTLGLMGLHLHPEHVTQVLGWVPLLAASVLTYLGVRAKVKSDKQTTVTDALRQDNAALRAENAALKQDNRQLEADKDAVELERDEARSDLRHSNGVNRDQAEVITSLVRDLMARVNWNGAPPPPDLSWRTTEYLKKPGDT